MEGGLFPQIAYGNHSAGRGEGIRTPNPQRRRILNPLHIPILPLPHIYKVSEGLGRFHRLGFSQPYILIVAQILKFVKRFSKLFLKIFLTVRTHDYYPALAYWIPTLGGSTGAVPLDIIIIY